MNTYQVTIAEQLTLRHEITVKARTPEEAEEAAMDHLFGEDNQCAAVSLKWCDESNTNGFVSHDVHDEGSEGKDVVDIRLTKGETYA